jgi:cytochrome c peroxidase
MPLAASMRMCGGGIARLLLVLICVDTAVTAAAPPPAAPGPGAGPEPITPIPAPPAQDPLRLALGEQLFRDTRLSGDNIRSCADCHDLASNGASANAHDVTPKGRPLALNTPTVFNATLSFKLNWEGNVGDFEDQTERILANPEIMASNLDAVLTKLRSDPQMVKQFRDAYGREPDRAALLDAIATYERSLLTPGSRFDLWLNGDASAITQEEIAGYRLFKGLGCISCHQGVNVGGNMYQRHGIFHPLAAPLPELLRVPSLRNVAATPPYFHDGSATTLREAVKAMGFAQLDRVLTAPQITAIVAFLNTLTGVYRGAPVKPAAGPHGVAQ